MERLGYSRYVAQGGDVGALVTDLMGRQAVAGLVGYHLNLLTAVLAVGDHLPKESEQERAAAEAFATFRQDGFGYFLEMATRPQTISYALLDSPVALAAWMLDHDTDSYYKISRAFVDGEPVGNLTRDNIVDNITLYWLTGTAASAARSYWEDARALAAALASGQPPPAVTVPVGFTTFPGEIWASPRAGSRRSTPTSPTSTRPTEAATSPPSRSLSSSPLNCGLHSAHCADGGLSSARVRRRFHGNTTSDRPPRGSSGRRRTSRARGAIGIRFMPSRRTSNRKRPSAPMPSWPSTATRLRRARRTPREQSRTSYSACSSHFFQNEVLSR